MGDSVNLFHIETSGNNHVVTIKPDCLLIGIFANKLGN